MPLPYLRTDVPNHETVMNSVLKAIPWIKDCCNASTLPNLLRVVLHVDAKYGNEMRNCFMENMESCEWVKSFSRSLRYLPLIIIYNILRPRANHMPVLIK
jgi:hypothetical protein